MKSNKLLEAIGLINEEYVDEAHGTRKKKRKHYPIAKSQFGLKHQVMK